MTPKKIILLSDREADVGFFKTLAESIQYELVSVRDVKEFVRSVCAQPKCIAVWDADNPDSQDPKHPYSLNSVRFVLTKTISPAYTFALTDKPINLLKDDQNFTFLTTYPQHNLIRSYDIVAMKIYSTIIQRVFDGDVLEFSKFFPSNAVTQSLVIKQSEHRRAAVEALQNVLNRGSVEKRLAAKVAQAADELLMNAIFDAPRESDGSPVRQFVPRSAQFELNNGKEVNFIFTITPEYGGVCVSDAYGTINKNEIAKYLRQNYTNSDYKPRTVGQGAGLGLYTIVQGGISLFIACHKDKRTDAMVFFRNTNSYKNFKTGFQFTACISTDELNDVTHFAGSAGNP